MKIALFAIAVLLLLSVLYILALRGRRNHTGLAALRGWNYAHRGLHGPERPENSMAAFRAALEGGYGIELDVHLLADGNLAVMHDSQLLRTTGQPGRIEDLTTEQLKAYFLEGTGETIPTFRQVLELFDGKAPMIVEIKSEENNYAKVTETVCHALEGYQGTFCLESFDPRCILWLRRNRPDLIRGQLSADFMKDKKYAWFLRFAQTYLLGNFLTKPDFIAYDYASRKCVSNVLCHKLWHMQEVSWTIKSQNDLEFALKEGNISIFEGFMP